MCLVSNLILFFNPRLVGHDAGVRLVVNLHDLELVQHEALALDELHDDSDGLLKPADLHRLLTGGPEVGIPLNAKKAKR